jgi:hypothetical protein
MEFLKMSAPLRIRRTAVKSASGSSDGIKLYLDRLLKLIPTEVVSLYMVGTGMIPPKSIEVLLLWPMICLIGVVVVRRFGTSDPAQGVPPDWVHVGISSVAFMIWTYSLGGPFAYYGLHIPYIGSLLIMTFTFFVPYVYKGPQAL